VTSVGDKQVVFYWSGGKDSAAAFHRLSTDPCYDGCRIASLLTTFTDGYDRVTGHGVRRSLIEQQARCIGLDLLVSYIPRQASMSQYEEVTLEALHGQKRSGVSIAASGDIFVEKQRLALLKTVGLTACCPLWERQSHKHVEEILDLGFKAYVVCVDGTVLDRSFVGRLLDEEFLQDLPTGVDPCGENGEFHTFVFDGPIFRQPIPCRLGEVVHREGFYFCDVIPDGPEP
jgi:uncharacterized protein (TIGR00290 family)